MSRRGNQMSDNAKIIVSKKHRRIIETATDLFMKFGVRRVTVEEICRTAGVSKMTFYKYYSNKKALLKSIWTGWLDEGYRKLYEIDAMDIPFREKLQRIIEYKMNIIERMSPAFMDDLIHAEPEMKAFIDDLRRKNISLFMEYIRGAQERGDMRKIEPAFFLAILDMMRDVFQSDGLRRLYTNEADFIREIHNFLFFGILPIENREG
jgi:AcrR family transcriptional regulator